MISVVEKLISALIEHGDRLPYVNLSPDHEYLGWTYDFNIVLPCGDKMWLDLRREDDLFLLLVLASSWSRTGPWENASFFVAYLKAGKKSAVGPWLDPSFVTLETEKRATSARHIVRACRSPVAPRRKVSFRSDFYSSTSMIARNWSTIKERLETANLTSDYTVFVHYMSRLAGLGAGLKSMRIKIPLILRELRCQRVYANIPGELCCVPDERVRNASKEIGLYLPYVNSIGSLLRASAIIYEHFGDLYDIPLFAYEDLKPHLVEPSARTLPGAGRT